MDGKLDTVILIYALLHVLNSGVGRVTPSDVKKLMTKEGIDVSDYFVRKSFSQLKNNGVFVFHHNHYKLDMGSGILMDLRNLTNNIMSEVE